MKKDGWLPRHSVSVILSEARSAESKDPTQRSGRHVILSGAGEARAVEGSHTVSRRLGDSSLRSE